jgi:carbon storage regulator
MLVLSRRPNESIVIGDDIVLEIIRVRGDRIWLGITAPAEVRVLRSELKEGEDDPEDNSRSVG